MPLSLAPAYRGRLPRAEAWPGRDRIRFWLEGARVDELKAEGTGKKNPTQLPIF